MSLETNNSSCNFNLHRHLASCISIQSVLVNFLSIPELQLPQIVTGQFSIPSYAVARRERSVAQLQEEKLHEISFLMANVS